MFDFQFAEGAPNRADQEERARLPCTSDALRTLLTESGRHSVVPTDPVRKGFAKRFGADTAITGEVQKVSNRILNINVSVKPLREGAPEQAYSVDLRGNTEESFDPGIRYLVKNRMRDGRWTRPSARRGRLVSPTGNPALQKSAFS